MNWKVKAYLQKVLGGIPFGNSINYYFQRKVIKNLPVSDTIFFEKVTLAEYHFNNFLKFSGNFSTESPVFYEFGAGWDLIIPMIYYVKGINNQMLTDINRKLKFELINNTLHRFKINKTKIENITGKFINQIPEREIIDLNMLKKLIGIEYFAPMNASNTIFNNNTVDFISNTSTFEHIPEPLIIPIMKECHRILKENAIMSCVIDLQDHYSYFDKKISIYNFLQFSDKEWKRYNHSIQYQNRLRASDFINAFIESGFEILKIDRELPDETEKQIIKVLKINKKFHGYSFEELSTKVLKIVLKNVKS